MSIALSDSTKKRLSISLIVGAVILMFILREWLSQDSIIIILLCLSFLLGNCSLFLKDWIPIFLYYFSYEFLRGHMAGLQSFLHITVNNTLLYHIDRFLFGTTIPVILAQKLILPYPTILDYISFIWYTSFFWFPIVTGYILWLKDRSFFKFFRNAYFLLLFLALITFLIFPAAPPWMASQLGILPPLITATWNRLYVGSISIGLFYTVGVNPVAPFPSLHVGWSVLSGYMLYAFFRKRIGKWAYLFFLYPLIMCLVVTYSSDHYVIDMIGGATYAMTAIGLAAWLRHRKQRSAPILSEASSS